MVENEIKNRHTIAMIFLSGGKNSTEQDNLSLWFSKMDRKCENTSVFHSLCGSKRSCSVWDKLHPEKGCLTDDIYSLEVRECNISGK